MNKKAFTLLELIIVILVMAILIMLALPQLENIKLKAYDREAFGKLNGIKMVLDPIYAVEGYYPEFHTRGGSGGVSTNWKSLGIEDPNTPQSKFEYGIGVAIAGSTIVDYWANAYLKNPERFGCIEYRIWYQSENKKWRKQIIYTDGRIYYKEF